LGAEPLHPPSGAPSAQGISVTAIADESRIASVLEAIDVPALAHAPSP